MEKKLWLNKIFTPNKKISKRRPVNQRTPTNFSHSTLWYKKYFLVIFEQSRSIKKNAQLKIQIIGGNQLKKEEFKMQHDYQNEWFWNVNSGSDVDHLRPPMANDAQMSQPTMPPSLNGSFTNGVVTDLSICVGMRDVHLSSDRGDYEFHHKINHWYNNLNVMIQLRNPHLWNNAYAKYFCSNGSASECLHPNGMPMPANDINQPLMAMQMQVDSCPIQYHQLYDYFSSQYQPPACHAAPAPPSAVPSSLQQPLPTTMTDRSAFAHLLPFIASEMKAQRAAMAASSPPSLVTVPHGHEAKPLAVDLQPMSFGSLASGPTAAATPMPPPLLSAVLSAPATASRTTCTPKSVRPVAKPAATRPSNKTTVENVFQRYCIRNGHVDAPKKKWIINYMMSKYNIYSIFFIYFTEIEHVRIGEMWIFTDLLNHFKYRPHSVGGYINVNISQIQ